MATTVRIHRNRDIIVTIGNNLHQHINQFFVLSIINLQHQNDSKVHITTCGVSTPQVGQSSKKWISRRFRASQRRNLGYYVRDCVRDKTHVRLARPHMLEQCISNPPLVNSKQRFSLDYFTACHSVIDHLTPFPPQVRHEFKAMDWLGYKSIPKTPELDAIRRPLLDRYGQLAQISQLFVLFTWAFGQSVLPSLDDLQKNSKGGGLATLARRVNFRLDNQVARGFGTYRQWLVGILWGSWHIFLCMNETGEGQLQLVVFYAPCLPFVDYMHFVKRFGHVGIAQLPLHFLLAAKHGKAPIQYLLDSSHELLISWHEVSGGIIATSLFLHGTLYAQAFFDMGIFWTGIQKTNIAAGLGSLILITILGLTSTKLFRQINYNWFYQFHVFAATGVIGLIYVHVTYTRRYVLQCVAIVCVNAILRHFNSHKVAVQVTALPESNGLVEIKTKSGTSPIENWLPGQHVYLNQAPSAVELWAAKNPFTIVTIPEGTDGVALVARQLSGNTKNLHKLGQSHKEVNVSLEGPYGSSAYLKHAESSKKILLVAGGVGATFIIPVWRHLVQHRSKGQEIKLVWIVKKFGDAQWAFENLQNSGLSAEKSLTKHLYITGIDENKGDVANTGFTVTEGRPKIDDVIGSYITNKTEKSAVIVCGPYELTQSVRKAVGTCIDQGANLIWHAEAFET